MKQRLLDLFRRYRLFLLLLALDLLLLVLRPATGAQAFRQTGSNLLGMPRCCRRSLCCWGYWTFGSTARRW